MNLYSLASFATSVHNKLHSFKYLHKVSSAIKNLDEFQFFNTNVTVKGEGELELVKAWTFATIVNEFPDPASLSYVSTGGFNSQHIIIPLVLLSGIALFCRYCRRKQKQDYAHKKNEGNLLKRFIRSNSNIIEKRRSDHKYSKVAVSTNDGDDEDDIEMKTKKKNIIENPIAANVVGNEITEERETLW